MRVQKQQPLRGMTLLEIMVVTAAVAGMAAMAGTSVADQVRRVRATEAAKNSLHPHTVARDRAVGARTCTETLIVPKLGDAFTPPTAPGYPANTQREAPRVAVIEWSTCEKTATISDIDFFDLDGDVTVAPYSTFDGRVIFSSEGGITNSRPGPGTGVVISNAKCAPTTTAKTTSTSTSTTTSCAAPKPLPPPVGDVDFSATTFFGDTVDYRIYARVGATEQLP